MKKEKLTKPNLTLKLQRETLRALEAPDLTRVAVAAVVTSFCRSGYTCCNASCDGAC